MEILISPPWFRGKASQTSLAGHAITISTPLGSGSKHLPLCTSFCSSIFCSINYNFKNTIYMKKITASVVIDAFVHITSIDIQVLEKRPYDMYNLFPHGSVTNREYLMLFRSAQSLFRLFFFIFQQQMKTERYWKEIFVSNLFALHLWSRKNMSYIKYFILVYIIVGSLFSSTCSPLMVLSLFPP